MVSRCAILACLFSGFVAVPALCERHDSDLSVKFNTVDSFDTAVLSLKIETAHDSLIAQKSVAETPSQNEKKQDGDWDWTAVGVMVTACIAVFTSLGWLYERHKKPDDAGRIRKAEIEAENEQKRIEEEDKLRNEKELLQSEDQKYIQHLREVLNKSEIFGFRGIDGAEESVSVSETFVPLDIDVESRYESEADRRFTFERHELDEQRYVTPEEALSYTEREGKRMLLIIGEPGSGKTTIIKYFALKRNLCLPGSSPSPVILYMPLRHMAASGSERESLAVMLSKVFHPNFTVQPTWIEDRLRQPKALVLLDGLDEISSQEQRVKVLRWLKNGVDACKTALFVMTTRDSGFRTEERDALQLLPQRAYVQRFTPEQQLVFLENWFCAALSRDAAKELKEGKKTTEAIKVKALDAAFRLRNHLLLPEMKGLNELAGIPLLLQIMAILWKQERYLPNNEDELYDHALDFLLERRVRDKEIPVHVKAGQAKLLPAPVALWKQDHKDGKPVEDIKKEVMHDLVKEEIRKDPGIAIQEAETVCGYLADQTGVLVDAGSVYAFRHKTFREYLAGVQLLTNVNDEADRLKSLAKRVGDPAWEEPLLFFMAKAKAGLFTRFMRELFDSEYSLSLDQSAQTQLKRLIERASQKTVDAFQEKLLDGTASVSQQQYLLGCLKTIGTPEAVRVALAFKQKSPHADREALRKADEVIGHVRFDITDNEDIGDPQEGHLSVDQNTDLWYSDVEYSAQYIRIAGCKNSDFYIAKYPVTNKQYRKFISSLQSIEKADTQDLFSAHLFDEADKISGFRKYLDRENILSNLFISRYDADRRFKENDQPVVGVSWYDAKAYCLWVSLVESQGKNSGLYRLPNEAEWQFAAAGSESRPYPWGPDEPTDKHANYNRHVGATTPVGRYPEGATPEGLYDMAGNVWEWMDNGYDEDKSVAFLRGGSWYGTDDNLRCSARVYLNPGYGGSGIGFRVVRPSLFS